MRRRIATVVVAGLLVACGGDEDAGGGDGGTTTTAAAVAPTGDFAIDATARCRGLIDGRDAAVTEAGLAASIQVVEWVAGDEVPSEDEALAVADDIDAFVDELERTRSALADLAPDDDADVAAWERIVGSADGQVAALTDRSEALRSDDFAEAARGFELGVGADAVEDELVQLGLVRRDCEVVFVHEGIPEAHRTFLVAAAGTCATIVERRTGNGFDDDTETSLRLLAQVLEEDAPEVDDDTVAALERMRDEWERTADDLAAVPTDDVTDEEAWDLALELAGDRISLFTERAEAAASGDVEAIAAAYEPGNLGVPGFELEALGLERRDCRSITN